MNETLDHDELTSMKATTATMENYLKAIFDLNKTKKAVRTKDIAEKLDVQTSSVTAMLKKLATRGLVKYRKYEYVELEDMGAYYAREIYRRYEILLRFLADILAIEKKTAAEEACKMEHLLSPETLCSLVDFMNFVESCPRARERWPVRFKTFRENGCRLGLCGKPDANALGA